MMKVESRYTRFMEKTVALLLLLYPGLMLAVKGGMNGSFLFLLLLSIGVLMFRPREMPPVKWEREVKFFMLAMAALPVTIFLSQSYNHQYSGHPYDAASRFILAVPILLVLKRVRFDVVARVQYAFPLAAIVGWLMTKPIAPGRVGVSTIDLIHFGDFELMLGVLSILSINWSERDAFWIRSLKILGFLAGVYASFASGSRGGWIALPIFMVIFIYFKFGKISFKALMAVALMLVMANFFAYTYINGIHQRVDELVSDLADYQHGNFDTSTGIRLQLFQVAADVFIKNPVLGVGPEGFSLEMDSMLKEGKITPMVAALGKGEVHNELLSKAAGLGIFGLIAMLSIYLVPFRIFYRAMRSDSDQIRQFGVMGLVFVSGFMIFGLTVEVLNLTMAAAFYSLTVAVLLAACGNIHHGDQIAKNNS